MIRRFVLWCFLIATLAVVAFMCFAIHAAHVRDMEEVRAVSHCFEGYAVVSFKRHGVWNVAQVFESGAKGLLAPQRCGRGPYNDKHWK